MSRSKVLKYILDIEQMIQELEEVWRASDDNLLIFEKTLFYRRTAERDLQILGEALKKLNTIEPNLKITSSSNIIGLRNRITHDYESLDYEIIWDIIIKDLPLLKSEIQTIKNN